MDQVVSLSFFRFDSVLGRFWALAMMGAARWSLSRTPDIGFWKLFGSGSGEGFSPRPNTAVWGIMTTWPDLETAQAAQRNVPLFGRYRARADENWTVYLQTHSVRGAWSGAAPFTVSNTNESGPLAVLTRASIKPRTLLRFWGRVPNISTVIGSDPNVMFKIGLGEMPWLHQVTFSIWPDAKRMANFARTGPHADAIKAVRDEGWFAEELYARFSLISEDGTWGGTSPLAGMEPS